jgi:hypothetical protein
MKYIFFIEDCLSVLVFEVLGASGAIWGTSDLLTLRNENTQELWRYIVIFMGFLFLIRYIILQRKKYIELKRLIQMDNTNT